MRSSLPNIDTVALLMPSGEAEVKACLQASLDEAMKLERAMFQLRTDKPRGGPALLTYRRDRRGRGEGKSIPTSAVLGWLRWWIATAPIWSCTVMRTTEA